MSRNRNIFVGTAGWAIPAVHKDLFPDVGSHLEKYATVFNGVEINSSFYRPHMAKTYERWAAAVPENFRFSVKLPKTLSHEKMLQTSLSDVELVLKEILMLKEKLAVLLLQLPPSLEFDGKAVLQFFKQLRHFYSGNIACEPRHITWFEGNEVTQIFLDQRVSMVIADPDRFPEVSGKPVETGGFKYLRLHGSPQIYKSLYRQVSLRGYAKEMDVRKKDGESWCIFDNTTYGHATQNAVEMGRILKLKGGSADSRFEASSSKL